ncbi:MAG TPA: hypothetical protein VGP64_06030 [Polyangia bacterium]
MFGAFLVAEGYVTEAQLSLALEYQRRLRQARLGDILVAQGAIPREMLERAALDQMDVAGGHRLRLGEFLVGEGLLREADVARALAQQERDRGKRLGELLLELGFLTTQALAQAVRAQIEDLHER